MAPVFLHEVSEGLSFIFDVYRRSKDVRIELLCYCWAIDLKTVKVK